MLKLKSILYFGLSIVLFPILSQGVELQGVIQQGAIVVGQVNPGDSLTLDGQVVKVSAQGQFVIGFDRDASPTSLLVVNSKKIDKQELKLDVAKRQYNIQRIEGIAKKIMSPNTEALKQIRRESALVRKARAVRLDRLDFAGDFSWPLKGPITGVYGSQRVYNGEPNRPHYGLDVAAPIGTPVTTPAPGKVTLAQDDMFYSGGTVIIDHGHGLSSTLMHLNKVLTKAGDEVKPGDIVGEVGEKGRATGPHLDWRMNWMKARVDPQLLVNEMPKATSSK